MGYTGEDGFEISVSNEKVEDLCDLLLREAKPAGLGARDSLRLEAGLCLHGNDMDETVSPAEAVLLWTVRKNVETKYVGYEALSLKRKNKNRDKRIGLITTGAGIPRHGELKDSEGNIVGNITSGSYSPVLKKGIAMAYVKSPYT